MDSGGESRSGTVNIVNTIYMALTVLVVCLRVYGRLSLAGLLGKDDILICSAALTSILFCISAAVATHHGLGRHTITIHPSDLIVMHKAILSCSLTYQLTMGIIKVSLIALYLRLSASPGFRRIALCFLAFIIALTTSNMLVVLLQCIPIQKQWDPTADGHCIDINLFYFFNAGLNIFTDFATYILPMRMLWRLHLPTRQKIGLVAIFGLGLLACVASVIRLYYLPEMLASSDPSWIIIKPMIWSIVEIHTAIFAASIPSLKALVRQYFPKLLGSTAEGYTPKYLQGSLSFRKSVLNSETHAPGASGQAIEFTDIGRSRMRNESEEKIITESDSMTIWTTGLTIEDTESGGTASAVRTKGPASISMFG